MPGGTNPWEIIVKKILITSALALSALSVGSSVVAQDIFALVPKNMNNPFFDQARDGCKKAEAESNGSFVCEYIGPGEHGGGDEQVQIVMDLIARGNVKGLGISPSNAAAMSVAASAAQEAGIPIITWDSDLLPEDQGLRVAYIGTHNYEIGVNLAKLAMEIKPNGGTVCIQSGGAAAANHNERMQGIRDTLGAMSGTTSPGNRLEGDNGWTEAKGCPLYTDDDFPRSVQQFEDFMAANPDTDAFLPTGGFPQFLPDANRAAVEQYKPQIADGSLALVVADTLPVQIDQMREGFSAGQVGQRPFEMGYRVMLAFEQMASGGAAPADPTYTGLDVCTPETADTCIAQ
jgi:ribose transport system substrate-binding protein